MSDQEIAAAGRKLWELGNNRVGFREYTEELRLIYEYEAEEALKAAQAASEGTVSPSTDPNILIRAADFVREIHDFRCVRAQDEGDAPFNVVDYYSMEDLEAQLRASLPSAPGRSPEDAVREAARAVVKAGWALSDVGHFLPDTPEGRAFDDALDALESTLRLTAEPEARPQEDQ